MLHCNKVFSFSYATKEKVKNKILNLLFKKPTRRGNIFAKVLKENTDIYLSDLPALVNDCVKKRVFPDELKTADVSLVFKKV